MDDIPHTAEVPAGIADMIPTFLNNRKKELAELRGLLAASDFEAIAQLAHRMIGVGVPYGFPYITDTARAIRDRANARDADSLELLVRGLGNYLATVRIVVVPD